MSSSDQPKQTVEPFWLKRVFPDPLEVFGFGAPPVSALFADALFVFDTNALLAPYQVSKQSVEEIERIYRELAKYDRLFVPDQAVREFGKNRGLKLADMFDKVQKLTSSLPKADPVDCPMLEGVKEYEELFPLAESIREAVKKYTAIVNSLKVTLTEWGWTDRVSVLYGELFTMPRIIKHDKKDDDFLEHLNWRYRHQVPPGYKDKSKMDAGVGDLDIWFSILKLGKDRKSHVVFVCNETKHDWVYRSNEQTITPRMELLLEFHRETGHHFALVNWPRFLELAGAKGRTVREARWASAKDYDLMPVVHRVRTLLDDIAAIVNAGPEDSGDGYQLLEDHELYSRIDAFGEAKRLYADLIRPPTGLNYLNKIERVLAEIGSLNRALEYMRARQKHSGDEESAKLKQKCEEFDEQFIMFCRATTLML